MVLQDSYGCFPNDTLDVLAVHNFTGVNKIATALKHMKAVIYASGGRDQIHYGRWAQTDLERIQEAMKEIEEQMRHRYDVLVDLIT
jgi:hypothetical protein